MRRKAVAEAATVCGGGTVNCSHGGGIEIVFRLDVGSVHLRYLNRSRELLVINLEFCLDGLFAVPVDEIEDQRAVLVASGGVHVRHFIEAPALVLRAFDQQFQSLTLGVIGEQLQRVIYGLQEHASFVRKDGRDDVHELRQIGDLHDVSVIYKRVQESGNNERVFQVVALL